MNGRTEFKPTAVPFPAKQFGEADSRWDWVDPCVWTDRMLTALESGVKGGQWIRMRLRSILRRRQKRKGRGVGWDNLRWKNAYFAERGLYSLKQAHVSACQASLR